MDLRRGSPPPSMAAKPGAGGVTLALEARVAQLESLCANLMEQLRYQQEMLATVFKADGSVEIASDRKVEIAAGTTRISLDAMGVQVQAPLRVAVTAAKIEVGAGDVAVNAARVTATGLLKCDTLQATSVIGQSYTPGAGNIM